MVIKYDITIQDDAIIQSVHKLTNQIYKLLPNREEGLDWEKPLHTIIEELIGMNSLLIDQQNILFPLLCKLEGLLSLKDEKDFLYFRRTIFECLNLMTELSECLDQNI